MNNSSLLPSSNDMDSTFNDLVVKAVKNTPSFPKVSGSKFKNFCQDLALVSVGFRTAFLVDTFSISLETVQLFVLELRNANPQSTNIVALFHEDLCQLFFCHLPQLAARMAEAEGANPWTRFLRRPTGLPVENDPALSILPTSIATACRDIIENSTESLVNVTISRLNVSEMIALAGFLLEYPISYFPCEDDTESFLASVPLDVFTCSGDFITEDGHQWSSVFMKFSRPSGMAPSVFSLSQLLKDRFENRCRLLKAVCQIRIECFETTMDRVAL
ncbi:hypothetical protein M422DRAFT_64120 [Sphaerobolus stellatus SS14]|nr:hypothetical protein M422DRAFT_64120 [Sphaerobolus stellatus SS14]